MIDKERDELVETIIRKVVEDEPRGELSPFFVPRTVAAADSAERKRQRSISSGLLASYWIVLLAAAILLVTSLPVSPLGESLVRLLVPIGFGLALYWRTVLHGVARIARVFLG